MAFTRVGRRHDTGCGLCEPLLPGLPQVWEAVPRASSASLVVRVL